MNNALQLFEADRKMELKLRLAAKRAADLESGSAIHQRFEGVVLEEILEIPQKQLMRLIERVRKL